MVSSVDSEALRRRYAEERDKRLRPDGNDQYLRLTDELAHYLDDPHTPWTERASRTDHRTVVCVGGGSRWDYDYTGGVPENSGDQGCTPMHGLASRRVGIIGTGATAVQCVPHLSRDAGELYVFQRTPSSVDARGPSAYFAYIDKWRTSGTFDGLEFR